MILPLIGMGISALGTGIQAIQNNQANKLADANYNKQRESLLTDLYTNPLDTVANKAILSQMDRRLDKQEQRVENAAAAGGATFENTLAAKQASNEAMADVMSGMLQGETARQAAIKGQLLNLDSQRTAQQMASKMSSGQAWANMGNNISDSLTTLGGVQMETGKTLKELLSFK